MDFHKDVALFVGLLVLLSSASEGSVRVVIGSSKRHPDLHCDADIGFNQ